ncbi:hypothetical protein [Aldersonia kunmingensis]|uniref:hypothetical protein n=1 Tax=Aldersonia kunmingensis TaxID=408066 RepID=UPI0008355B6B|nr:hypothetical protein [Aldersonia kunmingensis]
MTTPGAPREPIGPESADTDSIDIAAVDTMHQRPESNHTILYVALALAFIALGAWGIAVFEQHKDTEEALEKATALNLLRVQEGLPTLDTETVARVLGTDGAALCENPGELLEQGALKQQFMNGATGPGLRPILATRNLIEGERLIIQVYCPDEAADYEEAVNDLKLVDE